MDPVIANILLILAFVAGTGLIITEAFIPGFGVAGIFGIILEVVGIAAVWSRFGTGFALLALVLVLGVIAAAVTLSYRSAVKGRLSKSPLVLKDTENTEAASAPGAEWIGKKGITLSALRPSGFIDIGGQKLSAATRGEFLGKGVSVRVTGIQGDHLIIAGETAQK